MEFAKRFPSEEAKRQHRLGVQMNLCVTDFRADNAGTQYVVGSDKDPLAPHDELNAVPTEAGVGVFKDVAPQWEAEAGCAIIYDSRFHQCALLSVRRQPPSYSARHAPSPILCSPTSKNVCGSNARRPSE